MKLYFVRHGRTQWNAEGRFQGANGDSPLLEDSYDTIVKLGQRLTNVHFDKVYSSDLKRATDTARLIMDHNHSPKDIIETKALREWNLGKLEGQKISLIEAIYPSQIHAFRHNLGVFRAQNFDAESVYQATHRLKIFLQENIDKNLDNILLVGHGAHLTASIRSLLGFEPALLRANGGLDNASLTILETDDLKHYTLKLWNDTSHYNN
ncbi:histidine phosphatase family protein [Streptococcus halotolerans]|uniref:histidine phosphatase family protein n=1 Tax=Streptococcus halotolerans TaxID=1814128 RepID=UPI000787DB1D|nr:histidine phosphatase family protein [Streptococcus halotolerans]